MFYEPDKKNHGLAHTPYKSCIVPRPIGWISTISKDGKINLAPYSQFNNLGFEPGYLCFSGGGQSPDSHIKDSVVNAEETGGFVYNMATYELREKVSLSAQIIDSDIDEMKAVGLTPGKSRFVKSPYILESPINIECVYYTTLTLPGNDFKTNHHVVIGRVVGVHIKDEYIDSNGKVDILKIRPLARLGYEDYTSIESLFSMKLNGPSSDFLSYGLHGG